MSGTRPRIRSVHPDICLSLTLADIGASSGERARLERTFVRLLLHCDDEGRTRDDARLLKGKLYPVHDDVSASDLDEEMWALADAGLVVRYTADGLDILQVSSWSEYQHPQRPTQSDLPPLACGDVRLRGGLAEDPRKRRGSVAEDSRPEREKEGSGGEGTLGVLTVSRPQHPSSAPPSALPVARPRDALFDALAAVCGISADELTPSARGALNKAKADLVAVGASVADVEARAAAYRGRFPNSSLTPTALAKHWPSLNGATAVPAAPSRNLRVIDAALAAGGPT